MINNYATIHKASWRIYLSTKHKFVGGEPQIAVDCGAKGPSYLDQMLVPTVLGFIKVASNRIYKGSVVALHLSIGRRTVWGGTGLRYFEEVAHSGKCYLMNIIITD